MKWSDGRERRDCELPRGYAAVRAACEAEQLRELQSLRLVNWWLRGEVAKLPATTAAAAA